MHAFDYISVLFSFVYAAAVVHVLATAGDMASPQFLSSWLKPGSPCLSQWMLREARFQLSLE